jgi:hypothetical protein
VQFDGVAGAGDARVIVIGATNRCCVCAHVCMHACVCMLRVGVWVWCCWVCAGACQCCAHTLARTRSTPPRPTACR